MYKISKYLLRNVPLKFAALFLLILFAISSLYIFSYSFTEVGPIEDHFGNLDKIDTFDAACSGYSLGRVLREQRRVLLSVKNELIESQAKLQEIRTVKEELQRLIPQKQLELSSLEGEIEAAQRQLEELRENQNVRVFLPFSPLQQPKYEPIKFSLSTVSTIDDVINFSRCSISTFMPIKLELVTHGKEEKEWETVFKNVIPNLVESSELACLTIHITNGEFNTVDGTIDNSIIFNIGDSISSPYSKVIFVQESANRKVDISISPMSLIDSTEDLWNIIPPLLPYSRETLITVILPFDNSKLDLTSLKMTANDSLAIVNCSSINCKELKSTSLSSSHFCFIPSSIKLSYFFTESIKFGCIPIILSSNQDLPFGNLIDWRRASYRIPIARLPEAHFIVKSFEMADVLEMRRMGRVYFEKYLSTKQKLASTLITSLRYQLQIPTLENRMKNKGVPLFGKAFTSPNLSTVNIQPNFDDEYSLGPLETKIDSPQYSFNFTQFQLYSYQMWNVEMSPHRTKQYMINNHEPPAETEFYEDSKFGFRPIDPGSGVEFSKGLGGNRQREQFTVVLLTFERDQVLYSALERLHQLPYLNKIIVIWNNVDRDPPTTWPNLHVPIEFLKVAENSLNNRFIPWDRIETEAILSLDDDIDLMQQEIILAFRVWRENRDRIVGFPARHHARYGDSMFYNSNHTCQMSIILTGAAFIHKEYLAAYTYEMPSIIREHVDKIRNCEDIAMNYMVSHITRKPPIKTTSRWTLKCATCTERLSESDSHFEKRHECMRYFTQIYGYNPLRFSQFRADSILFKTRLPQNHQKCFKYV